MVVHYSQNLFVGFTKSTAPTTNMGMLTSQTVLLSLQINFVPLVNVDIRMHQDAVVKSATKNI